MTATTTTARNWAPPERPEWVARILEEGDCMDIAEVVPLDERSLLASATEATGLSDFGDDGWREPFAVYTKSLREEADLNLLGRLRARQEVLLFLKARLQIEDTYKRHPEIEDEEIREPIMLTGQGRSGTTFLQNVMSANPDHGGLRHWEMLYPCPPPEAETYWTDPRIERADRWVQQWNRIAPTLPDMHEFAGNVPFEDCVMMSINFTSEAWLGIIGQTPSYAVYLATQDPADALRYHKRVLKLLQWHNPRSHWVLKEVYSLSRMKALFEVYPDACVVWCHRDPVRAAASFVNMLGTMQWVGSDHPLKDGALDYCKDPAVSAARFNSVIDLLENKEIPADRICNIHYKDLVADNFGTLQRIYDYFGIPFTEAGRAGIERYLAEHPRDNRAPHRYPIPEGAELTRAREVYRRYQDYFCIPNEK